MPSSFPSRDLSNQYISRSYQDVVQNYTPGSGDVNDYFLDGLGNVIASIPTGSIGQTLITSDITSSMSVLSASYADISIISDVALIADTASVSVNSDFSISSSWASQSLSSSYALTCSISFFTIVSQSIFSITSASWASQSFSSSYSLISDTSSFTFSSVSSSYAPEKATFLFTGSLYEITSSQAVSASWAPLPIEPTDNSASWASHSINSDASISSSWTSQSFSSSFSQTSSFVTTSQTSSYILNAVSSSYSPVELKYSSSISTQLGTKQDTIITSSIYIITSSWANNSISASYAPEKATFLITSSTYQITSSWAINAVNGNSGTTLFTASTYQITSSWASQSLSSSLSTTSSYSFISENVSGFIFDNISTTVVITGSPVVFFQKVTSSFNTTFFDYSLVSGSNQRAGIMFGSWNNNLISFTEQTTVDIGDTSTVSMSLSISSSQIQFIVQSQNTSNWNIKGFIRYI